MSAGRINTAKPEHRVAFADLHALIAKHAELSAEEILAIAANMVGKLIALQDQRRLSPAAALEIVSRNIELGNQEAIAALAEIGGSA